MKRSICSDDDLRIHFHKRMNRSKYKGSDGSNMASDNSDSGFTECHSSGSSSSSSTSSNGSNKLFNLVGNESSTDLSLEARNSPTADCAVPPVSCELTTVSPLGCGELDTGGAPPSCDNHKMMIVADKEKNDDGEREDEDEDNEEDENDDSDSSDTSDMSALSYISGQEWKPQTKSMQWVQKQMLSGVNPRELLSEIISSDSQIPSKMGDMALWRIIANMLSEPPRRSKLSQVSTIGHVCDLLRRSKNIIVLTGAGVSVSCGIPDFRSRDGIYSRLTADFPDLPDPQSMFDINYFWHDPRPFYKFAREIYPGQFKPSPSHAFIRHLEKKQKLLRNYTQNIDTLEQVANIERVIECHGSFATASCTRCKLCVPADMIRADIIEQRIPVCGVCRHSPATEAMAAVHNGTDDSNAYWNIVANGVMKPDIVFFGEGLPDKFHKAMTEDKDKCDLLIVIGSSLKVRPVALIPSSIPPDVPQILINREPLGHMDFDVELLGDSDVIVDQICHMLGDDWTSICWQSKHLTETNELLPPISQLNGDAIVHGEPDKTADCQVVPLSTDESSLMSQPQSQQPSPTPPPPASAPAPPLLPLLCAVPDSDGTIVASTPVTAKVPSASPLLATALPSCSRNRQSIAERLPAHTFYKHLHNTYVFPGAEAYLKDEIEAADEEEDDEDDDDDEDDEDDDDEDDEDDEDEEDDDDGEEANDEALLADNADDTNRNKAVTTPLATLDTKETESVLPLLQDEHSSDHLKSTKVEC